MKRSKKYIWAGLLAALAVFSALGVHAVSAHDSKTSSSLVDKLVSKFNLNKDEVQKVFDEEKEARKAEMQKGFEERLQAAVDSGSITADQKSKILSKQKEMEEFRKSLESKTVAEAREAMKTKHEELKKWADENNIPARYLMFGPGGKMGHGMGGGHKFGW